MGQLNHCWPPRAGTGDKAAVVSLQLQFGFCQCSYLPFSHIAWNGALCYFDWQTVDGTSNNYLTDIVHDQDSSVVLTCAKVNLARHADALHCSTISECTPVTGYCYALKLQMKKTKLSIFANFTWKWLDLFSIHLDSCAVFQNITCWVKRLHSLNTDVEIVLFYNTEILTVDGTTLCPSNNAGRLLWALF